MLTHPRHTSHLYGHEDAEQALLEAFNQQRLPHAWLITGPQGIGKASLAYRFARFLLSAKASESEDESLFGGSLPPALPESMVVDPEHPVFHRIEQGSHADLFVLEPTHLDEHGKERANKEMRIWQVRKLGKFLSQTAAESNWRVVIVDSADDMNSNAANALLKALEEPPPHTIMLLISHNPGRLLPTIRSRCRYLPLKPLNPDAVMDILRENSEEELHSAEAAFAISLSDGSPGLSYQIYHCNGLELYAELVRILQTLPDLHVEYVQKLAGKLAKKEHAEHWQVFVYMLHYCLARIVRHAVLEEALEEHVEGEQQLAAYLLNHYPISQLTDYCESIYTLVNEGEALNMSRQQMVVELFSQWQT